VIAYKLNSAKSFILKQEQTKTKLYIIFDEADYATLTISEIFFNHLYNYNLNVKDPINSRFNTYRASH